MRAATGVKELGHGAWLPFWARQGKRSRIYTEEWGRGVVVNDECDSKEGASWGEHVVSISAARSATNREQNTNGNGLLYEGRSVMQDQGAVVRQDRQT